MVFCLLLAQQKLNGWRVRGSFFFSLSLPATQLQLDSVHAHAASRWDPLSISLSLFRGGRSNDQDGAQWAAVGSEGLCQLRLWLHRSLQWDCLGQSCTTDLNIRWMKDLVLKGFQEIRAMSGASHVCVYAPLRSPLLHTKHHLPHNGAFFCIACAKTTQGFEMSSKFGSEWSLSCGYPDCSTGIHC